MGIAAHAAAWTAFAVAALALLIALAQVLQQYVSTAQGMRMCDSLVWGPMPGRSGQRIWIWHQLRFKVVFEMPNVFIPTEYWWTSGNARNWPAHRVTRLPSALEKSGPPNNNDLEEIERCSEACWVSFARHISKNCSDMVRVGLLFGDSDRIPSDLCAVPMQASLRDVIALGLLIGMTINSVGSKHLEMNGPSGSITSSQHQILGLLIRFSSTPVVSTPRGREIPYSYSKVHKSWFHRLQGIATVAQKPYTDEARNYYQQFGQKWRDSQQNLIANRYSDDAAKSRNFQLYFIDITGHSHTIAAKECLTWGNLQKALNQKRIATPPYLVKLLHPDRYGYYKFDELGDGFLVRPRAWEPLIRKMSIRALDIKFKIVRGDYDRSDYPPAPETDIAELSAIPRTLSDHSPPLLEAGVTQRALGPTNERFQRNGARPVNYKNDGSSTAQGSAENKQELSAVVGGLKNDFEASYTPTTKISDIPQPDPFHASRNERSGVAKQEQPPPLTSSPDRPNSRKLETDKMPAPEDSQQPKKDASPPSAWIPPQISESLPYPTSRNSRHAFDPPTLTFFWASQVDIEIGPFACPWPEGMFHETEESLDIMVTMATTALSSLSQWDQSLDPNETEVSHVDFPGDMLLNDLWLHLKNGGHTWPAYAINGHDGTLEPAPYTRTPFAAFPDEPLPSLRLIKALRYPDVARSGAIYGKVMQERLVELSSIDHWLSHAATTAAILSSETNLLINTPAILEEIWLRFFPKIFKLAENKSNKSNFEDIKGLVEDILRFMDHIFPSRAAQYFTWVAFLRATKVWQCVYAGASTKDALELFKDDLLIHMA